MNPKVHNQPKRQRQMEKPREDVVQLILGCTANDQVSHIDT